MATQIVKTVEAFEISITGTSNSAALTKSQTVANCVPFMTSEGPTTTSDLEDLLADCYFSGSSVYASRLSSAGTKTAYVYVVEFDSAYVDVQQGTFSIADGNTTGTASISAVTIADSWLIAYHEAASPATSETDSNLCKSKINTTTQLEFERNDNTSDIIDGHWYLAESTSFDVQHFADIDLDPATQNTTITAVVLADSFVIADHLYFDNERNPDRVGVRHSLTSTTNLLSAREDASSEVSANAQVIECQDSEFEAQRGDKDMDGEGTSANITISSVDTDKAIPWAATHKNGHTSPNGSDSDAPEMFHGLDITSATNLELNIAQGHTGQGITSWEVVEWAIGVLHAIAGTISTTTTVSADLDVYVPIAGTFSTTTSVQAAITKKVPIAGTLSTSTSIQADVGVKKPISGTLATSTSVQAAIGVTKPIAGTVAASTSVAAALGVRKPIAGTVAAETSLSAALDVKIPISGVFSTSTSVQAGLQVLLASLENVELLDYIIRDKAMKYTIQDNAPVIYVIDKPSQYRVK
jgi:hypothetical protein